MLGLVRRAPQRRLVPLFASLALLVPAPTAAAASSEEPAPDPMAGAPAVGTCSTMTWDEAFEVTAPEGSGVRCDRPHTTQVVHVGELPEDVAWEDLDAVYAAVGAGCAPAFSALTGTDLLLIKRSLYTAWSFLPTQAERESGARWYRCDVALASGERFVSRKVAKLPAIGKRVPAAVGRCLTRQLRFTPCSGDPVWKHTGAVKVRDVSRREARARKQLSAAASQKCPDLTYGRNGYAWSSHRTSDRSLWVVVCYSARR